MAQQYAPKTFLRQTSNSLLRECFAGRGALAQIPWEELAEHEIDPVYDGWQELPDEERIAFERCFEDAEALANEQGIKAIIEEGQFHGLDLAPALEVIEGNRNKVMWVALHHPRVFEVASIINGAHTLPQRHWRRRGGLPLEQPDVSPEVITTFANAIGAYYRQNQGRGHRCTVDAYLRVNRYHYFFAYPDDYADTYLGHDDAGNFIRRPQKPAFEVVFIFDPQDGAIDLFAQGGKQVHEDLQTIFCRSLLGRELPPELPHRHPYELNGLKSRNFRFPTDPEDGIEQVRVRKLRLSVLGGLKRRITLEGDPEAGPGDVYDMMDEYLDRQNLPDTLVNVTQATVNVKFVHTGEGRQKTLTFDISFPDSSNLKSKREDLRIIAEKYLKRWGIDRA
jgi:hypothetical protein